MYYKINNFIKHFRHSHVIWDVIRSVSQLGVEKIGVDPNFFLIFFIWEGGGWVVMWQKEDWTQVALLTL